jgi:hypothetical protein
MKICNVSSLAWLSVEVQKFGIILQLLYNIYILLCDAWLFVQSFMDVQFPNGQVTYVAGEGITASGLLPLFGGLLQAHGKCPGETRVSFSFKVSTLTKLLTT